MELLASIRRNRPRALFRPPSSLRDQVLATIRSAPPERPEGDAGALQTVFNYLDAPRNVVANLANLAVGAEPTSRTLGAFGLPQVSTGDLLNRLGVQFRDDTTGGKVGNFLLDFVGNVVTDPLTYATLGTGGILGTAAKKIGGQVFKEAGAKAVQEGAQSFTQRVAERAAKRAGAAMGADEATEAVLERLGQRVLDRAERLAGREAVEAPTSALGRKYARERGSEYLRERVAERVARQSPELVDRTALGLSTRGAKEFGIFDLPVALATGATAAVAPNLAGKASRVYQGVRPLTTPFAWLPRADVQLLSKQGAGKLADRVGLSKLPGIAKSAIRSSPTTARVVDAVRRAGEEIGDAFSTRVRPPRPGDDADALRYEGERFEKFAREETAQAARRRGYTEVRKLRPLIEQVAAETKLEKPVVDAVIFDVIEALEARDSFENMATRIQRIVVNSGGTVEQARKIANFVPETIPDLAPVDVDLFGNPLPPRPQRVEQGELFPLEELQRPQKAREPLEIKDGLRQMVARVVPEIPGKARPDATTVRRALIDRFGSASVQQQLKARLRGRDWEPEIDEAIDQATRGMWLIGPDLAPRRAIGERVKLVDADLNEYDGELAIVDADDLVVSHRPVRMGGKVVRLDADPDYPPGFQAREREAAGSVKQVAGIASRPKHELLLEFGADVTGGPPVVFDVNGRPTVIQGNGRAAGMLGWDAAKWKEYRQALEGITDVPEGIKRPVLVRRLRGSTDEARRLAARGQQAATLRETRVERARAALNALNVGSLDEIPSLRMKKPVTRDNVEQFLHDNPGFRQWLTGNLTEQRREQLMASRDELAERVNDVFVAMLPAPVQRLAAKLPEKVEQMFVTAAPIAAYLRSLRKDGLIRPQWDLYDNLADAAVIWERFGGKRRSYANMLEEIDRIAATDTFTGLEDEIANVTPRGLALVVGMERASRAADPSASLLESLNRIVDAAVADDPRQATFLAIDPVEAIDDAYLGSFGTEALAEKLRQKLVAVRARQAEGKLPIEQPAAEGVARQEVPPAAPPVDPPAVASEVPPSPRGQLYQDLRRTWAARGNSEEDAESLIGVIEHFSDDAVAGLRVDAGTAEQAREIAEATGYRPAAAYYPGHAVEPADRAALAARGMVRLFDRSESYDDAALFIEEMGHHYYRSVLSDDERGIIDAWYRSRERGEWAATLRERGIRTELADYYSADPNELFSRYFADYVAGKEISAGRPVQSIFQRLLGVFRGMWEQLTGAGKIGTDARIRGLIQKHYRPPVGPSTGTGPEFVVQKPLFPSEPLQPSGGEAAPRFVTQPELIEGGATQRMNVHDPVEPIESGPQGRLIETDDFPGGPRPGRAGELRLADPVRDIVSHVQGRDVLRRSEEGRAGLNPRRLTTERRIGYLTRFIIDNSDTQTGKFFRQASMSLGTRAKKMRTAFREKFVSEINGLIDDLNSFMRGEPGTDPRLGELAQQMDLAPGEQLARYNADPLLSHVWREIESVRLIGSAAFADEMIRRFGVRVHEGGNMPAGYTHANAATFGDRLREFAFRPEIARILEQHATQWKKPSQIMAAFDRAMNLWKGWALFSPAYHLRNMFGNVFNSMMGDAWDPDAFRLGRQIQEAIAGNATGKLGQKIKGTPETWQTLYDKLAIDHGAIGAGFFGVEYNVHRNRIERIIEQIANPPSGAKWRREVLGLHPLKANRAIGEVLEDASKIGFVIARLRKGDDVATAVDAMKRHLFDYTDLTSFERDVMRRVIPFYTWTRKNAALMLTLALTEPRKLAQIPKIQLAGERALAGEDVLPPSLRPEHIQKEGGMQISGGDRPKFMNLGYMLPVGELRFGANPLRQGYEYLRENAGGPLGTVANIAANYDPYFERKIQEYPGQRKQFLGIDMPPAVKELARTFRPANELEQIRRLTGSVDSPAAAAGALASKFTGLRTFEVDAARQVFAREREYNGQIGAVRRDLKRRLAEVERSGGRPEQDSDVLRLLELHQGLLGERERLPAGQMRSIHRRLSGDRQRKFEAFLTANQEN